MMEHKIKRAIVMISIGDRPWADASFATFQRYAKKFDADAHLLKEDVPLSEFDLGEFRKTKSRPNKRAYALKSYIPWKFMAEGYDKVVLVDDSCSVHPYATSIFEEVPEGHIGYTRTNAIHAQISFDMIADFQSSNGEELIELNPKHYANSGVVVYDRKFMDAFDPKLIFEAKELLYNRYPHQTLLYYLVKKSKVPVKMIPKKFNSMPGIHLEKPVRATLDSIEGLLDLEKTFISHYPGSYKKREILIQKTSLEFLRMWDQ